MIRFRNILSSLTVVIVTSTIAACTPPLPPELQAQLADNSINCGSAPVTVSSSPSMTPILEQWSNDYLTLCPNAGATFSTDGDGLVADVAVTNSSTPPATCDSTSTLPIFVGAVSIVLSLQGLDGMILDAPTLSGIINGVITSWSDPQIVAINPQFDPIDLPVNLSTVVTKSDADAIDAWMSRLSPDTWKGFPSTFTFTDSFDETNPPTQIYEDGGISFVPFSFASMSGLQSALIKVDPAIEAVPSALENIASAASQLSVSTSESPLETALDATKSPVPAPGFDVALDPYQAIVVNFAHVCSGGSELDSKSFIRFGLRTSSQALLVNYGYFELPTDVRGVALELVSRGLPSPSPLEPDTAATP